MTYRLTDTYSGLSSMHETLDDVAEHVPTLFRGTPMEIDAHLYADLLRAGNATDNTYLGLTLRED